jgi:colicin import membrane protein
MTPPSVLNRPTDRPPREERLGAGTTLSLVAHAALVGALWWGVHWRTHPTAEGTTAELWAAVPQIAAPPPTEQPEAPPPPAPAPAPVPAPEPAPVVAPKTPDIVVEQEKERKLKEQQQQQQAEQAAQKAAQDKAAQQKAADDKAKADAEKQKQLDQQKLAKLRQDQLNRVMGQLGAPPDSTGNDARNAGPSADYMGRVIAYLKRNLIAIDDIPGNPSVDVDIQCAPDGTIISRRIVKSSGSQAWDDAVLRAIDRTQTLPRDVDGKTPHLIPIRWHPKD